MVICLRNYFFKNNFIKIKPSASIYDYKYNMNKLLIEISKLKNENMKLKEYISNLEISFRENSNKNLLLN